MYIHSVDIEITVALVCEISDEVQNVQISTVRSISNPVAPEVDSSQHGMLCSENGISNVVACQVHAQ